MSEETTNETTTTTEAVETEAGVGGIVGEKAPATVETLDELVLIIRSQREMLVNSNQRNVNLFNQLQEFITEKSTGITQLDGAITAVSEFVNDDTAADDEHVVRLTELQNQRSKSVEQIQNADTQRRNVFNSITMTEGALQILTQVLSTAGLPANVETEESDEAKVE